MYKILLDNLSGQALKDLITLGEFGIKKGLSKDNLVNEIITSFSDASKLNVFKKYYTGLSKVAKKEFFIFHLSEKFNVESFINSFNALETINDIFVPNDRECHIKKYQSNSYIYEIKVFQKKSNKTRDKNNDRREGDRVWEAFIYDDFIHEMYFRFDLNRNYCFLAIGEDNSIRRNERLPILLEKLSEIFGMALVNEIRKIDCKDTFESFLKDNQVITRQMYNKNVNQEQSTKYSIDMDNVRLIKKRLNSGEVLLEDIKTEHINCDVADHQVFRVKSEKNEIREILREGRGIYFYRCNINNNFQYMRFDLDVARSSFKISTDHTSEGVVLNVLSRFI